MKLNRNSPAVLIEKWCLVLDTRLKSCLWILWQKFLKNKINVRKNKGRRQRYLEIGSGGGRIEGFETVDVVGGPNVDYVYDASKSLPFNDNTFDLIYSSHVLEHIPWYLTEQVLKEWV